MFGKCGHIRANLSLHAAVLHGLGFSRSLISINCSEFALSTSFLGNGADAGEMTIPGVGEGMVRVERSSVFWMVD